MWYVISAPGMTRRNLHGVLDGVTSFRGGQEVVDGHILVLVLLV
jgi:hypothetical protein